MKILLPKYDNLVIVLSTQNRNSALNFEDFNTMLLEEEMHPNIRNREDSAFSARTKKSKGNNSSNPSSADDKKKKKNIKCFCYSKLGLKQKECQKKLVDEKDGVKRESSNSA